MGETVKNAEVLITEETHTTIEQQKVEQLHTLVDWWESEKSSKQNSVSWAFN